MHSTLLDRWREFLKEKSKNEMWRRITSIISALVVIGTVYILIYPAIATSRGTNLNHKIIMEKNVTTPSLIHVEEQKKTDKSPPLSNTIETEEVNPITTNGAIKPDMGMAPPFAPGTVLPDGTIIQNTIDAKNVFNRFRMRGMQLFSSGDTVTIQPEGEPYQLNQTSFLKGVSINGQFIQNGNQINISAGDQLKLELNYEFPVGTLQYDNSSTTQNEKRNTFVYTMDKIRAAQYREGKIVQRIINEEGKEIQVECGIFKIGKKEDEDPNIEDPYKTAENKIFLIFDDNAVTRNQTQKFDEGKILFNALIAEVEVDQSGDLEIHLSQEITSTFKLKGNLEVAKKGEIIDLGEGKIRYTIEIKSPTGTGGEVKVTDGMLADYVYYRKVKRLSTTTKVSVIKKSKGSETELTDPNVALGSTDFNFTLPRMKPSEEYHITYEAKLSGHVNTVHQVEAINEVTAEADNYTGVKPEKLTKTDKSVVTFSGRSLLRKAVELVRVEEDGQLKEKLKWVMRVNEKHMDLDGWVLTDNFNGKEFKGPVKIYRESETSTNLIKSDATLPFTFSGTSVGDTKSSFLVIYYSDPPILGGTMTNIGYLQKDTLKAHAERIFKRNDYPGVLSKWFADFDVETYMQSGEKHFRLKLDWRIAYSSSPTEPVKAPWILYDRLDPKLSPTQYFSAEELSRINQVVKSQLKQAGVSENSVNVEGTHERGSGRYGGFKIIGNEDIPPNKYISFEITSMDDLGTEGKGITGNGYQRDSYHNKMVLTHKGNTTEPSYDNFTASAGVHYRTPIIKWDVDLETYNPGDSQNIMKKETVYNYYAQEKNGEVYPLKGTDLLRWEFCASIPYTYHVNNAMILEDIIPEGMKFDKNELQIRTKDGKWKNFSFGSSDQATLHLEDQNYEITATHDEAERKVKIVCPADYVKDMYSSLIVPVKDLHPVRIRIGARIIDPERTLPMVNDPLSSTSEGKKFRNEANLYFENASERTHMGLMSQTKKVVRSGEKPYLYKWHDHTKGETVQLQNNRVHYTLIVNPNAERLLPVQTGATLDLEDLFSYKSPIDKVVIAKLDENSVKVYKDTGSGGTPGSPSDTKLIKTDINGWIPNGHHFNYEYSEDQVISGTELNSVKKIKFKIPDGKRIRIEYDYEILQGKPGQDFAGVNKVRLSGHAILQGNTTSVLKAKISSGSSSISAKGIYFQKVGVDKQASGRNVETILKGATFQIHKYKETNSAGRDIYEPIKGSDGQPKIFTTGESGKFLFVEYDYNTAYKLVEVSVPGYIKEGLEFFILHVNNVQYPDKMPAGFKQKNGVVLGYNTMTQEVKNEKNEVDLILKKNWKQADGELMQEKHGQIKLKLFRKVEFYNEKGLKVKAPQGKPEEEFVEELTLQAPQWSLKKRGLPKRDQTDPSLEKRYQYYVKEVSMPFLKQYTVTYSSNNQLGITEGEIVITNQRKWQAALPETGGRGRKIHYIIGFGLISLAAITRLLHRQSVDKHRTMRREGV